MTNPSEQEASKRCVIVEFDFAVLPGHPLLLDCCSKRLAKEGVTLDFGLMARNLCGKTFLSGFQDLCEKQGKTPDIPGIVSDCRDAFAAAIGGELPRTPAPFLKWAKALQGKGVGVTIVSRLEADALKEAFEAGGCPASLLSFQRDSMDSFGFLKEETLRNILGRGGIHEQLSAAVVASGYSCKNALICGMSVIAKPNEMTDYQDFSGCNRIIDGFSTSLIPDVLAMLHA